MKKLLSAASFLLPALLIFVFLRTVPAQGAQSAAAQGLEARVAALESELQTQKRREDETRALLDQTLAYLEAQAKASQTLLATLNEVEQQGFAVGENWRSRQTLLAGFRAYWGGAQTGLPKAPAPAKPGVPAQRARQ